MRMTDSRASEIIKQVIEVLYECVLQTSGQSDKLLTNTGFVGCGDGPQDLSMTYKGELGAPIRSKPNHH